MACPKQTINIRTLCSLNSLQLIQKCQEWNLLPGLGEKKCPHCFKNLKLVAMTDSIDGYRWWCGARGADKKKKRCCHSSSLRAGTFFASSKLQMWRIVAFIRLWIRHVSIIVTCEELEISERTYLDWSSFCGEAIYDAVIINSEQVGGPGTKVRVYESKFGKRKHNLGYRVEGQWIFGGFEEGTGKMFMVPVASRSTETLLPLIKRWIHPETTIISDGRKSYDCLTEHGYKHLTANHSTNHKNPETGAHNDDIEVPWEYAKKMWPPGGNKFMAGYLAKYMFLKLCKIQKADPFLKFCAFAGQLYDGTGLTTKREDHTYSARTIT